MSGEPYSQLTQPHWSSYKRKVIRIITRANFLPHTDALLKKTGLLKLHDIHLFQLAVYSYENKSNGEFNAAMYEHFTRNRDLLIPAFQRLTITQHSLTYSAPAFWNKLPQYIRDSNSLPIFRRNLKLHLLEQYRAH